MTEGDYLQKVSTDNSTSASVNRPLLPLFESNDPPNPLDMTRQQKVDAFWRSRKEAETRENGIQVIPYGWGWKTSGMGKAAFAAYNPNILATRTITVDSGDPTASEKTGGLWTIDFPTDEDFHHNEYAHRGAEMFFVFPKEYLMNEDATDVNPHSENDFSFKKGTQFTLVGIEDVRMTYDSTTGKKEHPDEFLLKGVSSSNRTPTVYQYEWKRYVLVPKGYEGAYFDAVEKSTTDPHAKQRLAESRRKGELLTSQRDIVFDPLSIKEGQIIQPIVKGDQALALPIPAANLMAKFLIEAYEKGVPSPEAKGKGVTAERILQLFAKGKSTTSE